MIFITSAALFYLYTRLRELMSENNNNDDNNNTNTTSGNSSLNNNNNTPHDTTSPTITTTTTTTTTTTMLNEATHLSLSTQFHNNYNNNPSHTTTTTTQQQQEQRCIHPSTILYALITTHSINGTGILVLPWAFYTAGPILSTLSLIIVIMLKNLSQTYLLESVHYAHSMTNERRRLLSSQSSPPNYHSYLLRNFEQQIQADDDDLSLLEYGSLSVTTETPSTQMLMGPSSSCSIDDDPTVRISNRTNMVPDGGGAAMKQRPMMHSLSPSSVVPSYYCLSEGHVVNPGDDTTAIANGTIDDDDDDDERPSSDTSDVEAVELCRVIFDRPTQKIYILFNVLFTYGMLWSSVILFAGSMARTIPLYPADGGSDGDDDDDDYAVYAALFSLVTIPVSCLEFEEKKCFQAVLSTMRMVLILVMMGMVVMATSMGGSIGGVTAGGYAYNSQQTTTNNTTTAWLEMMNMMQRDYQEVETDYNDDKDNDMMMTMFRYDGWYKTVPILVFATTFHRSPRTFSEKQTDSVRWRNLFMISNTIWGFILVGFGMILASFFRERIKEGVNWNWFDDEDMGEEQIMSAAVTMAKTASCDNWEKLLDVFVLAFPALDAVSSFPINAISLGKNLMSLCDKDCNEERHYILRPIYIIPSVIPPVIGAILIRDLATIADYTGVIALVINFAFPAIFYIRSRRWVIRNVVPVIGLSSPLTTKDGRGRGGRRYAGFVSSECWAWVILCFCVGTICSILVKLAMVL